MKSGVKVYGFLLNSIELMIMQAQESEQAGASRIKRLRPAYLWLGRCARSSVCVFMSPLSLMEQAGL